MRREKDLAGREEMGKAPEAKVDHLANVDTRSHSSNAGRMPTDTRACPRPLPGKAPLPSLIS